MTNRRRVRQQWVRCQLYSPEEEQRTRENCDSGRGKPLHDACKSNCPINQIPSLHKGYGYNVQGKDNTHKCKASLDTLSLYSPFYNALSRKPGDFCWCIRREAAATGTGEKPHQRWRSDPARAIPISPGSPMHQPLATIRGSSVNSAMNQTCFFFHQPQKNITL